MKLNLLITEINFCSKHLHWILYYNLTITITGSYNSTEEGKLVTFVRTIMTKLKK